MKKFHPLMATPWGKINSYHKIADGVIIIDTPGHGGLWLSEEQAAKLPDDKYKSFTGSKQWAEEDEDAPLALQYLGLLSLIKEPLELEITEWDIFAGRESRKDAWGEPLTSYKYTDVKNRGYIGGPIVEAYKRQTQDNRFDEMICNTRLSPKPGGFQLAKLCEDARKWMKTFDAQEPIEPATFTIQPYRVLERKIFQLTFNNGSKRTEPVSGRLAQGVIDGNQKDVELYLWLNKNIKEITYEGQHIYPKEIK